MDNTEKAIKPGSVVEWHAPIDIQGWKTTIGFIGVVTDIEDDEVTLRIQEAPELTFKAALRDIKSKD